MTWNWTAIGPITLAGAAIVLALFNFLIISQASELNKKRNQERCFKRNHRMGRINIKLPL
jgi:Tfp pilus assembly protein PilO